MFGKMFNSSFFSSFTRNLKSSDCFIPVLNVLKQLVKYKFNYSNIFFGLFIFKMEFETRISLCEAK